MQTFILGTDIKPCLWPTPINCTWTDQRLEKSGPFTIWVAEAFQEAAGMFISWLEETQISCHKTNDETGADIIIRQADMHTAESYNLTATRQNVNLEAANLTAARSGLATLYQLISHSPDPSIHGVIIKDEPAKPFRGACASLPEARYIPHFKRFVDMLARYKINKLILNCGEPHPGGMSPAQASELLSYVASRGIEAIPTSVIAEDGSFGAHNLQALAPSHIYFSKTDMTRLAKAHPGQLASILNGYRQQLAENNISLMVDSTLLFPATGSGAIRYNPETKANDVTPQTWHEINSLSREIIIADSNHGHNLEDTGSCDFFTNHGFSIVFAGCGGPLANWEQKMQNPKVKGAYAALDAFCGETVLNGNGLYGILKTAQMLWQHGYRADHTAHGYQMPMHQEKTIYQLYPKERDAVIGVSSPAINGRFCKLDIREHYNTTLSRTHWRRDDYYFNYLFEEKNLPNTVPFYTVQGVLDPIHDNALVAAGGDGYPQTISIPINKEALSLVFLHAAVPGRKYYEIGAHIYDKKPVGSYTLRYSDGTTATAQLIFNRNIGHWKNYYGDNIKAYLTNPVMYGINEAGLRYTALSYEWVNPKPGVTIASVDITGSDIQIIVKGITAVVGEKTWATQPLHPSFSSRARPVIGETPLIWPIPAVMTLHDGCFGWEPGVLAASCDGLFSNELALFAKSVSEFGVEIAQAGDARLTVTLSDDADLGEEGYRLEVTSKIITISALTCRGAYYGLMSVCQLFENTSGSIPTMLVIDQPFKSKRGMHFYVPGRENLAWFKRFIDFVAKYKYNHIAIEVGAAMEFESHPEINQAWVDFTAEMMTYPGGPDGNHWGDTGMQMDSRIKSSVHIENGMRGFISKAELKEVIEYAKARHIEVIPEVQSLAHAYWMLLAHPECSEIPGDKYPDHYCPSNPRTYEILFNCMTEIVEVFDPKEVLIGHDEIYWLGMCERCKGSTGHDLFARDVVKLHGWLAARGIKTIIFSDRFIDAYKTDPYEIGMGAGAKEEPQHNRATMKNELALGKCRAIDAIPDDILMWDWYHAMQQNGIDNSDFFAYRGFDSAFGNFHCNVKNVEDRLRRPNVHGAEVSLWHETSDHGFACTNNIVNYLDCINILWNRGYTVRDRARYNRVIAQIYPKERDRIRADKRGQKAEYTVLDISPAYNAPMVGIHDYRYLTAENKLPGSVPFALSAKDPIYENGLVLAGFGTEIVQIPVNGKFDSISVLHDYTGNLDVHKTRACSYYGNDENLVGEYVIEYVDGGTFEFPINYARNIYCGAQGWFAHHANPVYMHSVVNDNVAATAVSVKQTPHVATKAVFSCEIANPYPHKEIVSLWVRHKPQKEGAIAVFGITGVSLTSR